MKFNHVYGKADEKYVMSTFGYVHSDNLVYADEAHQNVIPAEDLARLCETNLLMLVTSAGKFKPVNYVVGATYVTVGYIGATGTFTKAYSEGYSAT